MKTVLAFVVGLMVAGGAAWATSYTDTNKVRGLVEQYKQLKAMQTLTAQDITGVSCNASHDKPGVDSARLRAKPGDTGFNALLTALNTVLNAKATAAKAELEALGVTNVP